MGRETRAACRPTRAVVEREGREFERIEEGFQGRKEEQSRQSLCMMLHTQGTAQRAVRNTNKACALTRPRRVVRSSALPRLTLQRQSVEKRTTSFPTLSATAPNTVADTRKSFWALTWARSRRTRPPTGKTRKA